VRAILPRNLITPIAYAGNREEHHHNLATTFRVSQGAKRSANALKAAERKKKKDAEKGKERALGETYHGAVDDEGMAMDIDSDCDPGDTQMTGD
jgi:hypothetical protein